MPDPLTRDAYHAALNQLVTDTFGVGRREWRVRCLDSDYRSVWRSDPEWAEGVRDRKNSIGTFRHDIETRLVPLDCCASLDAVRQVEEAVLRDPSDLAEGD